MKYIDTEKLIAEIEKRAKFHDDAMKACVGLNNIAITHSAGWKEDTELLAIITFLQQEQPDNEDIDKVAQELYEQLYELKRRNNVPTNLYDKQEIIDLWKAGIVYGRSHPKQEQPEVDLEKFTQKMNDWKARYNHPDNTPIKATMAFTARMFYQYPNVARQWYDSLPKVTMD